MSIGVSMVFGGTTLPTPVDATIRESLVSIAWDGRASERLAVRWETLDGGTGLRLFLHPSVRFHDGTALTANLAADIIRRNIPTGSGLSFRSVTAVEAEPEANAIVIRTSRPEAFLLTDLADSALSLPGKPTIGTGPYQVAGTTQNTIGVRAFTDYYRGRPAIDEVTFRSFESQRSAWAAMLRGEIDVLHEVSREAVEFVEEESAVESYSFPSPYYTLLGFNMKHPILGQAAVRRALSLAIDRPALVRQALRGRGDPAQGPLWPFNWAYTSTSRAYSYNPEAAKLRLDAAGFPLRRDGAAGEMPSRFAFTCALWAPDPRFERLAIVVQKQLYDIGVDMRIVPITTGPEWGERMLAGNFDAFLAQQSSGRTLAWVYRFFHSPPPNTRGVYVDSGYRSADDVLDRLRSAQSDRETREAVDDLQRILYEDPPAVFLAWGQTTRAVRTDFTVPTESGPDIMGSLWRWKRSTPAVARR